MISKELGQLAQHLPHNLIPEVMQTLLNACQNEDLWVDREAAREVLAQLTQHLPHNLIPEVTQNLLNACQHESEYVRRVADETLVQLIHSQQNMPHVLQAKNRRGQFIAHPRIAKHFLTSKNHCIVINDTACLLQIRQGNLTYDIPGLSSNLLKNLKKYFKEESKPLSRPSLNYQDFKENSRQILPAFSQKRIARKLMQEIEEKDTSEEYIRRACKIM